MAFGMAFDVRKPYREFIDEKFQSPLMRAFFYGFPSYSGQTYSKPAPGALTIPYLMLTHGVWWPIGGIGAIPASFAKLAADIGVRILTGSKVSTFVHGQNRITAVETFDGEQFAADVVISNLDRLTTEQLLGRTITSKPSFSYFTVHWGLPASAPKMPNLAHHTLLIPKEFTEGFDHLYRKRRFPEPPIVYLNETSSTDPATAPKGASNLFAVITVPAEEPGLDWRNPAPFIDSTLGVMRRFGIEIDSADFQRVQTPITFRERDGNYRGTLYGVDESERILGGMFPLTNRDRIPNLFYCGGSVQPGAGLPMVTLSGQFAADLAHKYA
jgi:phytoene dehydrogenase-like protein